MRRTPYAYALLLVWGCGDGIVEVPAGPGLPDPKDGFAEYPVATVFIKIEEGSVIEESLVKEGCGKWGAQGIGCHVVQDADIADITFRVDPSVCEPLDESGRAILALASWDEHSVTFFTDCIGYPTYADDEIAELRRAVFVVTVAHEVGHHLGIWQHVPPTCDEGFVETEEGVPLCGPAIMNPGIDERLRVSGITAFDVLAFERRERYRSVLIDEDEAGVKSAHRGDGADCVLHSE